MDACAPGSPKTVRTTCPYCGVGCGVLAKVGRGVDVVVSGDPEYPANFGRLCSKGSALAETLGLDGRLLHPEIGGRQVKWDDALDLVAHRFSEAVARHGPGSVAFYVSGQLLTEDYYVANKLMKGFISSANIDTNSRLCMASAVAGHRRAFGSDTVPAGYEDLETADLVVLVGSNLAWCHPVLFQRLMAAKESHGTRVVVVDPRRTATAEGADLHLPLRPGSDIALYNGLLRHLHECGATDEGFVSRHARGLNDALEAASACSPDFVAHHTGLPIADIRRCYELFASTGKVVTVFSQGVNQSVCGTDKVNAIINCHLLTGRIGKPGAGPFSVTGQPNAMGGREVGGLANQLAAHLMLDNPAHRNLVSRFWRAPRVADGPGFKAVDLFRAVADGRIKALWIMATNPVDSMPDADLVREALRRCPFVAVSDVVRDTDTAHHAHVLLPAAAWGEKDGTVTNSERRISRQRAFRPAPGEARPDWWIICEAAKRMGHRAAFDFSGPAEIFREHAALSTFENHGRRDFDIGGLAGLTDAEYDRLQPVRWPVRAPGKPEGPLFGDGHFFTDDRRARFVAVSAPAATSVVVGDFPFVLNTGRVRDHWHTMTRTARSPRLSAHVAEPFVEIHPADAAACDIAPATLVEVESPGGRIIGRAFLSAAQRPGSIFVPMHWTDQLASNARTNILVRSDVDPASGQAGLKESAVTIRPWRATWYAFAVVSRRPSKIAADYWALAVANGGYRFELAGLHMPDDWTGWARRLLSCGDETGEFLAYHDTASCRHRFAAFECGRLVGAVFVAPEPVTVSRGFAVKGLVTDYAAQADRLALLAGRAGKDRPDPGAPVCSCFDVGINEIADAVVSAGCRSVEAIGGLLKAGTNCGSCRPEIRRIIHERTLQQAG